MAETSPSETGADNESKLSSYESDLSQIQLLLKENPNDQNLLKLEGDLVQVIQLTKTLISERATLVSTAKADNILETSASGIVAKGPNTTVASAVTSDFQPNTVKKKKKSVSSSFYIGGRCEVEFNGRWYASVIDNISTDDSDTDPDEKLFDIRYIVNNREEKKIKFSAGRIRKIRERKDKPGLDIFSLKLGASVFAKYSGDGEWYKAKVIEIAKEGCVVKYVEYGNKEKVPFEYMYYDKSAETEPSTPYAINSATASAHGIQNPATRSSVPEHLKILPTDTEAIQKNKKRKLKDLKRRSKNALEEHMSEQRQRGWQNFQAKKKGKRTKGHYASIKKKSMFAVPEGQIDGKGVMSGRVGVIGSGKGMTKFKDTRVKYK